MIDEFPDEDLNFDRMVKMHIKRVLEICNGNRTHAAKALGKTRFWLQRKLRTMNLGPDELVAHRKKHRAQRDVAAARKAAQAAAEQGTTIGERARDFRDQVGLTHEISDLE